MKKVLLIIVAAFFTSVAHSQCTITNATSCICPGGAGSDCDLLPDITISWYALKNYSGGPTEYPQTGAGADNGRLRVTGSTPNIGYGPFCVRSEDDNAVSWYICGTDTFSAPSSQSFTCPNGATPKVILFQRIYHKSSNAMTYQDRMSGPQPYNQGSMNVDDWGIFSLRLQNPAEPDPRRWPKIGPDGHKQAFCLMDYGSCSTYNGHCRDDNTVYNQGTALLNADFPNWGLGNNYGCSDVEQGCSVGYTDIYNESLNGMWINIPPGTCNGDYWIVYEVDPRNNFVESNEANNFTFAPFTLTLQDAPGNPHTTITADRSPILCGNDSVTLTANGALSYLWSTGETLQSIRVAGGTYSCTSTTYCGTAASDPFVVISNPAPQLPPLTNDTICVGGTATFTTIGTEISWYDNIGNLLGSGNTFTTPPLTSSTTYHARDKVSYQGALTNGAKADSGGSGGYYTGNQWLIFNAMKSFMLRSVKVYSNTAADRDIQLLDANSNVIQSGTFNIPTGESRVDLNFSVPTGTGFRLRVNGAPNLWRDNAGVTYPYTIADTLSITGSSGGANFYYFFYDWEIDVGGSECFSGLSPVTAIVEICTGMDQFNDFSQNISLYPNPSNGKFTFQINIPGAGENVLIKVVDLAGRVFYTEELRKVTGNYQSEIDLTGISKGMYRLVTEIAGRRYFKKVIII